MKRFNYVIKLQFVLKTLSMSILAICLFAGILILDKFDIKKVSINSVLIVGTIYILPSLLLFIEYLLLSSKISIQIAGKEITIVQNISKTNYQYSDISFVTKFCSFPYSQNRRRCYFATDCFYFFKIKMNDNKEFIITSLMTDLDYSQFDVNKVEPRFIASTIFE